jgi:hypothetical protein
LLVMAACCAPLTVCGQPLASKHADFLNIFQQADTAHDTTLASCPAQWPGQPGTLDARLRNASVQYFPALSTAIFWREFTLDHGARCVLMDYPIKAALTSAQASGLQVMAEALQRRQMQSWSAPEVPSPDRAQLLETADGRQPPPLIRRIEPSALAPCAQAQRRENARAVALDPRFSAVILRIQAHECPPDTRLAGSGSGVLLTPNLALTAAHVLIDDAGQNCTVRFSGGAKPFTDANPTPNGVRVSREIRFSGIGNWQAGDRPRSAENASPEFRVKGDYAGILFGEAYLADALVAWPLWQTAAPDFSQTDEVILAGYPHLKRLQNDSSAPVRGLRVASGRLSCDHDPPAFWRIAATIAPGDSGGPIMLLPAPFGLPQWRVMSIISTAETYGENRMHVLGTRFDLTMYENLLAWQIQADQLPRYPTQVLVKEPVKPKSTTPVLPKTRWQDKNKQRNADD